MKQTLLLKICWIFIAITCNENLQQYKNRLSLIVEQILAFTLSTYLFAWLETIRIYFRIYMILIRIRRSALLQNFYYKSVLLRIIFKSNLTFTCLKSTKETVEKGVKIKVNNKNTRTTSFTVFLLLVSNISHTLFNCFLYWLWTGKC